MLVPVAVVPHRLLSHVQSLRFVPSLLSTADVLSTADGLLPLLSSSSPDAEELFPLVDLEPELVVTLLSVRDAMDDDDT